MTGCREMRRGTPNDGLQPGLPSPSEPADQAGMLEEAIDNLSLGIVIFDSKREVVFCNRRYMEIYGLSPEQVKPGTPTSELIQHRLNLGLKVRGEARRLHPRARRPRRRARSPRVQEFADGRIIAYTVHPMPDGGGMATHEDITEREEMQRAPEAAIRARQRAGRELAGPKPAVRHRDQQHVAGPVLLRRRPPADRVQRPLYRDVRPSARPRRPRHAADGNRRPALRGGQLSRDVAGGISALALQRCGLRRAHRQHRRIAERKHLQDPPSADARSRLGRHP